MREGVRPLPGNVREGVLFKSIIVLQREFGLMSLAIPSDGRGRSGSGETQARPEATGLMTEIYELVLYLNEKSFKSQRVQENLSRGVYM